MADTLSRMFEGQEGLIQDGENLAVLQGVPLIHTSLEDAHRRDPRCNRVIEDFEKDFVLETDASDIAVSAVLNQRVNGALTRRNVWLWCLVVKRLGRIWSIKRSNCTAII